MKKQFKKNNNFFNIFIKLKYQIKSVATHGSKSSIYIYIYIYIYRRFLFHESKKKKTYRLIDMLTCIDWL